MSSRAITRIVRKGRNRGAVCIALGITVAVGLGSRAGSQIVPDFVAAHFGDALWTVAVYLGLCLIFPRASPLTLGAGAMALSVVVELTQLLQFGWLASLRGNAVGRLFLGSGFLWVDLVRYFAGATIAVLLDTAYQLAKTPRPSTR